MKRYSELSKEELFALQGDDERRKLLIELEMAFAGIIPVEAPKEPTLERPDLEPEIEAFEVNGLVFLDEKDAMVVAKLPVMEETYDYSVGAEYRTLMPKAESYRGNGVMAKRYYDKAALALVRMQLVEIKREKEAYDKATEVFKGYQDSISKIRAAVNDAVEEAVEEKERLERAKKVYERHLVLAEGDEEIAKNFFREAYKGAPEMVESILGEAKKEGDE